MKHRASRILDRLATAYDLVDEPFKARAFQRVAWPIRKLDGELEELLRSGQLADMPGYGRGVLRVIEQVVAGGEPAELAELEARIPPGVLAIAELKGLGPAKVKVLWKDLGISTMGELEYACRENRLVTLKGFGARTQDRVLDAIERARRYEGWYRRDRVQRAARQLLGGLLAERAEITGDFRRGCELVRGLEVVVAGLGSQVPESVDEVPVLVHICPLEAFGTAWLRTTGCAEHVAALEARGPLPEVECEEEVYEALGLPFVPPERREADVPLGETRRLLERTDLLGALHNHTTASDGVHSLTQLRDAAAERGLSWLGISEHSKAAFYANGLDEARLAEQMQQIAAMNADDHPTVLLAGLESDILQDGSLDCSEALGSLDFVVASVHSRFGQSGNAMTERMCLAARNPRTRIVGHPTGRLLLGRPAVDYDVARLLEVCAEQGVAVELNASPHRLDLHEGHLKLAKALGLKVSIAADAHSIGDLDNLEYGVSIARRAGLEPGDVLNCLELGELRGWLGN